MRTQHRHQLTPIKRLTLQLALSWERLKQKIHYVFETSRTSFEIYKEPIEVFDRLCDRKNIVPKKLVYENYRNLEHIFNEREDLNYEIQRMVFNFDIVGLNDMEVYRKDLDQQLNFLSYLQNTNDDLIWEAYHDIVTEALVVVKPTDVKPETIQLMQRMLARKILSIEAQILPVAPLQPQIHPEEEIKST